MVADDRLSPTRNIQRKGHGMKHINGESAAGLTNVVALRGTIRGVPTQRHLPSGSVVTQFDVATRDGTTSRLVSVPVAWVDPSPTAVAVLVDGTEVVVAGAVERRFFRVGGATQSRTEVIATTVVPARRRTQADRVVRELLTRFAT